MKESEILIVESYFLVGLVVSVVCYQANHLIDEDKYLIPESLLFGLFWPLSILLYLFFKWRK